ncbi:MAG: alpha/beta fold hydrolase [Solirubrobacteraceae bacterium]
MEPLLEYRRSFGGFETRVLELEGAGPPLVLLHGWADSADTWRLLLAELAAAERRAVAIDLPGFGTAPDLRPGRMLPQLDRFLAGVIPYAAGDGGPAVVVGNSLGGTLALRAAERSDELAIAGVVPIAPAGFDMAAWFGLIERNPILQILLGVPAPLPEAVVREAVGRVYALLAFPRPTAVDRRVIDAFTSHLRDRATVARRMRSARRLLPELAYPFHLDRVGCPVLLVWGERDRMVSPQGVERVVAALPETRVELIGGCGHCPQIEVPERLAELLMDFPRERSPAA